MTRISSTLFITLLSLSTTAQTKPATDTSYHLLWFKGKMIKQNVLLTPNGDTVTYSPSKGTIKFISKNGSGKKMDGMLSEMTRTPQRIDQMIKGLSSAVPKAALPYFAEPVKKAFTNVSSDFASSLSNTISLPELPTIAKPSKGGPSFDEDTYADELDAPMAEVLAYYEKVKNEKITWVPTPPRMDYSYCASCDSSAEKLYERDFEVFKNELLGQDEYYYTKALSIMHHAQLVMPEQRMNEVNNLMRTVFDFLTERQVAKVRLLVKNHINDPSRVLAIIKIGLPIERQRQLLGSSDTFLDEFYIAGMHTLAKMLQKAMNEYDYPIALNVDLILSLERYYQLMGITSEKSWQMDEMLNFNRFKMSVKTSAKMSGGGGYILAELEGDNYFSAIPDKQCKLQWILMGPNEHKMQYKLLAAEASELRYVGSKNWASDPPKINVDFCDETKKDSIEMFLFHESSHKELWQVPNMGVMQLSEVAAVMMGCFINKERIKQIKERFNNPAEVQKLLKSMNNDAAKFMANSNNGTLNGKSPSQMTPQEIQKLAMAMNDAKAVLDKVHEAAFTYLFELHPGNRTPLVLKESIDGKVIFPENANTEYAWMHISLQHDPNSPYKLMNKIMRGY